MRAYFSILHSKERFQAWVFSFSRIANCSSGMSCHYQGLSILYVLVLNVQAFIGAAPTYWTLCRRDWLPSRPTLSKFAVQFTRCRFTRCACMEDSPAHAIQPKRQTTDPDFPNFSAVQAVDRPFLRFGSTLASSELWTGLFFDSTQL